MQYLVLVQNLLLGIVSILTGRKVLDESLQSLEIDSKFFCATIDDVKQKFSSVLSQRGKKRKRDNDLHHWLSDTDRVLAEVRYILESVSKCRNFQMDSEMTTIVREKMEAMAVLQKKGGMLLSFATTGECAMRCGNAIPVNELIGEVAPSNLKTLQEQFLDPNVGSIAIYGKQGMGKTILMKHLYNWALTLEDNFKYVLWVTLSDNFSVMQVQDAIAKGIGCVLSGTDDAVTRAKILYYRLTDLGSFALFLDGIFDERFSLTELGIPLSAEGNTRKLVLTTNSSCVCEMLDCTRELEIQSLKEKDAWKLFTHYALLDEEFFASFNGIPYLLAKMCCGVPRKIEGIAVSMRSIVDIPEWRHELSKFINLLEGDKQSYQDLTDGRDCKKMKKEDVSGSTLY